MKLAIQFLYVARQPLSKVKAPAVELPFFPFVLNCSSYMKDAHAIAGSRISRRKPVFAAGVKSDLSMIVGNAARCNRNKRINHLEKSRIIRIRKRNDSVFRSNDKGSTIRSISHDFEAYFIYFFNNSKYYFKYCSFTFVIKLGLMHKYKR